MKFDLSIDGRDGVLEIEQPAGGGSFPFLLDSRRLEADARETEPGVYSILIDGRSYEVRVEPGADGLQAAVNGRRYVIEVRDPRRLARARAPLEAGGRQTISSPMPGKVVRLLAREGDQVAAGQGLLVVEAMKMQNEIRSPKSGRLAALRVAEGAAVAGGEILAEVE